MSTTKPKSKRPAGARQVKRSEDLPLQSGYLKTSDGTRLFYSIEGSGEPLIFCYGLVCSSLHWTYQIEHLKTKFQCIWFDYRGHQNSETPKDLKSLNIQTIAKDLSELMDHLKIEKASILGHSMGVNVVLDFYKLNPKRVKSMVLANGTPRRPLDSLFQSNVFELGFKILKRLNDLSPKTLRKLWSVANSNDWTHTIVAWGGFNPHLTPREDIVKYVSQISAMDPEVLIRLSKDYESYDATSWIHKIKVPCLIIGGENDQLVQPEHQQLMNQLIPNSELVIVPRGSHCPQMDLPWFVNPILEQFLSRITDER